MDSSTSNDEVIMLQLFKYSTLPLKYVYTVMCRINALSLEKNLAEASAYKKVFLYVLMFIPHSHGHTHSTSPLVKKRGVCLLAKVHVTDIRA